MPKFTNAKWTNFVFFLIIFLSYLGLVLKVYFDVGASDWNFQNTLPTANVSPFMFCTTPIYFILPKKAKEYYLLLISLLSVGMFLSGTLGCVYYASINYKFHPHFLLDFSAHFAMFLWGIYIIKSNQAELKLKKCLISGSIIFGVAIIMLILNAIFDTTFFGLNLNGKHNIYNNVLVSNSYLSALIYFSGLMAVLLLGFLFNKLLNLKRRQNPIDSQAKK